MNKKYITSILLSLSFILTACTNPGTTKPTPPADSGDGNSPQTANPASVYCIQKGGNLDIRTDSQGGQVGYCVFSDGSECEEWEFMRNECVQGQSNDKKIDMKADAELIKLALISQRKLDLTGMQVTLKKDTGLYAAGSVTPIEQGVAGGGYVFAAKVNGGWKIVADGNGQIDCFKLTPYPEFPTDMISECVDTNGTIQKR